MAGVRIAAGHARPPDQHVASLRVRNTSRSALHRCHVAAVTVDEHHAGRPVGRTGELDDHGRHRLGADRQRSREALRARRWPRSRRPVTRRQSPRRSARSLASAVAMTVSVSSGRCGPCCSQLPIGTTTNRSPDSGRLGSAPASSVQVMLPSGVVSAPMPPDASDQRCRPGHGPETRQPEPARHDGGCPVEPANQAASGDATYDVRS